MRELMAAAGGALALQLWQRWQAREECEPCDAADGPDGWMLLCHAHRRKRTLRPSQSHFRVTALVTYHIDAEAQVRFVVGHNDEACCLLNGVCAERAAFLQLAALAEGRTIRVTGVHITTDSENAITPGALCREYMASSRFTTDNLTIVMEAHTGPASRMTRALGYFWSHGSPYTRLDREGQVAAGERLQARVGAAGAALAGAEGKAWRAACDASAGDDRSDLHPIAYGAAVVFEDGSVASACQKKALEYGCTQDAVCQLAPQIAASKSRPLVVCQADQYGVCHAPSAVARAYLAEFGFGSARILAHDGEGTLSKPSAEELMPGMPMIFP